MNFKMLRFITTVVLVFLSLMASAVGYSQGDTIDVAFTRGDTIFIQAEWFNPDSLTATTEDIDGRTVIKPGNSTSFCYTLDVDQKSVYDFYFVSSYITGDPYFFGYLNNENFGDSRAAKIVDVWSYSTPKTDWSASNLYRKYRSMTFNAGLNQLKFKVGGGSNKMYVDYFMLVPKQVYRVTDVPCVNIDTIQIEAEDYHPDSSIITDGNETIERFNDDYYIGNVRSSDWIVYPLNVGSQGGKFKVAYTYANPTGGNAWYRPYLNDAVDYWGHYNVKTVSAIGSWITTNSAVTIELLPGDNQIRIKLGYSGAQYIESITLIGTEVYGGVTTQIKSIEPTPLTISPNPVNNELRFLGNAISSASIYDFSGRELKSQSVISNMIDVSQLKSGVYLVSVTDESGAHSVQRFIKK